MGPWCILEKIATLYAMVKFLLFVFNLIINFYNAFSIHKAIGKQASLTKMLLSGKFGIFSHTLTQLIAEAQEIDNTSDDSDNISHPCNSSYTIRRKRKNLKDQSQHQEQSQINITQSATIIDNDVDDIYVDTIYKHYKPTVRRSNKEIQLKNFETKSKKLPIPERRTVLEPFQKE